MRPGLTEKAFRAQEETIAYICLHYPNKCTFVIKDGSVATKVARLRDAIASYKQNHWTSLHINWEKFDKSFHKGKDGVEIVQDGETIIARPRGQKPAKKVEVEFLEDITDREQMIKKRSIKYSFHAGSMWEQIYTICTLITMKVIDKPITFKGEDFRHAIGKSNIEDAFDIHVETLLDGSIQIS